jgi:hypothetical protein
LKKNLAFAALALVFLLGAAFQSPNNSIPDQLKAIQSWISDLKAEVASNGPRKFYLTKTQHNGNQALSACAAGYHMASLWEIHDPTNLRYDTGLGRTAGDSGFGPTSSAIGWIRTGADPSFPDSSVPPGSANCSAWTSAHSAENGTAVYLSNQWQGSVSVVDPWVPIAFTCDTNVGVWCVQD